MKRKFSGIENMGERICGLISAVPLHRRNEDILPQKLSLDPVINVDIAAYVE